MVQRRGEMEDEEAESRLISGDDALSSLGGWGGEDEEGLTNCGES